MTRIPLQIKGGKLILTCVIECRSLRIRKQLTTFVIDTGSSDSYISMKDAMKLQIAESLPSILGLDFLKEQKLSLHVVMREDLAFLELDL